MGDKTKPQAAHLEKETAAWEMVALLEALAWVAKETAKDAAANKAAAWTKFKLSGATEEAAAWAAFVAATLESEKANFEEKKAQNDAERERENAKGIAIYRPYSG